jgi:hypothetical protein
MLPVVECWLLVFKKAFLDTARLVALHKFWVALTPATLAPLYLWLVFRAGSADLRLLQVCGSSHVFIRKAG